MAEDSGSNPSALILAGGLGTRLSSVLADRPKVLAPVNGRPFLAYLLDQLVAANVRRVVLSIGYLGDQVEQTFQDRYAGIELSYSREVQPLGTGGALRLALPLVTDPVLVMNGDSYCDIDLQQFVSWHRARDAENSILLTQVSDSRRFGRVWLDSSGFISRFEEKQEQQDTKSFSGWINAGIYLLSRRLLSSIPENRTVSLEREVFPAWVGRGLQACPVCARFVDIGTPDSYAMASSYLPNHLPSASSVHSPCAIPRLVILDRDGTINAEKQYLAEPDNLELLGGAVAGIRRLRNLGLRIVVITNQSGVGRGYFDESTLRSIHLRLQTLLAAEEAPLDAVYFCPHRPDQDCDCRKPRPGLLQQAAREFQADLAQSFVIGDKALDIEAGRRVGAKTLLVRTGYGAEVAAQGGAGADHIVDNLEEAAEVIERLIREGKT